MAFSLLDFTGYAATSISLTSSLNPLFSRDEFKQMEADAQDDTRLERVDGYIYAMAGAGLAHERAVARTLVTLAPAAAAAHGCEVYSSNRRLSIGEHTDVLPDVSAYCDPGDVDEYAGYRPCLVVEVLSPSTALNDLNLKVPRYQQVESIETILLINTDPPYAGVFTRDGAGWAREHVGGDGAVIKLTCPPCEMQLATLVVPNSPE